ARCGTSPVAGRVPTKRGPSRGPPEGSDPPDRPDRNGRRGAGSRWAVPDRVGRRSDQNSSWRERESADEHDVEGLRRPQSRPSAVPGRVDGLDPVERGGLAEEVPRRGGEGEERPRRGEGPLQQARRYAPDA